MNCDSVTSYEVLVDGREVCASHISDPPFLVALYKKPGQKPPVQILSQLLTEVLFGGVCQRVFFVRKVLSGVFCPFPLLSEYICYNRKLNITLNFMFHMYYTKMYK